MRGEGFLVIGDEAELRGSPPRAWGRRRASTKALPWMRFTPTCVGKAISTSSTRSHRMVHPHVRGEGWRLGRSADGCIGSPPRAWGRRTLSTRIRQFARFTPTCVGKAQPASAGGRPSAVHPHVRGEGVEIAARLHTSPGSPPRAWGRRRVDPGGGDEARFTPTCVGKACADIRERILGYGSPPRAWGRL